MTTGRSPTSTPAPARTWPLDAPRWCGDDDRAALMLTPMPGIGRDDIDAAERSLWRYRAALPPLGGAPISMGEGRTPLVPRALRRRHRAPEMRVVHADRLLQGPRRLA